MAIKKTTYNEYELQFLERKLKELEEYIDAHPFDTLHDRKGEREGKYGPAEYVIQTKENQRKDLTLALKEYAEIARQVGSMREAEDEKRETRGNHKLPLIARNNL